MIYMYTNIHFVEYKIKRDYRHYTIGIKFWELIIISVVQLIKWNAIIVFTDHCMDIVWKWIRNKRLK